MPRKETAKKLRGVFEHPAGSGVWWIHYYDADRKRRREKVGRRGAAIDLYRDRKADARKGIKLPTNLRAAGIKFKALTDDVLEFSKRHHKDTRNVESRIKRIEPDFGERNAESIKPAEIDGWISKSCKTPATGNRYRALFSLIFREALRNGKVSSNPARLVRQRHEANGRIRYLKPEEEKSLRSTMQNLFPEHLPELTISIGTGMRLSEQYGLFWKQVDFGRTEIHLLKTKNGDARDIPMNSSVLEAFNSLGRGKPSERVFAIDNPRKWFEIARDTAQVIGYRWHDNRHTFCSRLAMAGVGLKTIQTLAGHKTISMTARYSHLSPNTLRAAVELIAEPTATTTATTKKS
jgi:site-specific recombinase XerD